MDALKAKGYDAVGDINDRKYSGYGTKNPLILLGDTAKLAVNSRRELGTDEVNKAYDKAYDKLLTKAYAKAATGLAAQIAVGVAATKAASKAETALKRQEIVDQYKREHPNSQLSNKQILDNYYGEK